MTEQVKTGFLRGTGAAINVELGFVPDFVMVINMTDGDLITCGALGKVMAFTSGSLEIQAGDKVSQSDTIYATVRQVILDTGSYAGGDAAGWLIFDADQITGTFTAAAAAVNDSGDDDFTAAAIDEDGVSIAAAVAGTTTAATSAQSYVGAAGSAAKGFTVGATVSEDAKLLFYVALRGQLPFAQ